MYKRQEQTSSKSISEYTVNAARGKIVDRYGNELVTNKAGYNLVFDYAFLDEESANDTILELTNLLSEADEEWVDELPISQTRPNAFLSGRDDDVIPVSYTHLSAKQKNDEKGV